MSEGSLWVGLSFRVVLPSLTRRVVICEHTIMNVETSNISMKDPIAFFVTWPTYGTWLPGDERGWIEYHHGWQLPSPNLESLCSSRMTEKQCLLSGPEQQIVEEQAAETCRYRGWILHAVECRTNHVHLVVSAFETNPKKIRADIKAWCTRRLKEKSSSSRMNYWAERGSIRYVWDQESLDRVVNYVTVAQDRKHRDRER